MYVGKRIKLGNSLEVANEYKSIAESNLKAARLLQINGMYNECYYYYIQAMEKNIKAKICTIVDIANPFLADQMNKIGHSLDEAIDFLLKLVSGNNEVIYEQIKQQMVEGVLKNIRFSSLHNNVRYPNYSKKYGYSFLKITCEDCIEIEKMQERLEKFINELDRL